MNPRLIRDALMKRPFDSFRLVLTTGETFDVIHADQVAVAQSAIVVGIGADPTTEFPDRFITIALAHIVRLEQLKHTTAG